MVPISPIESSSAQIFEDIAPADGSDQPFYRAIYVGGAGNLAAHDKNSNSIVFTSVNAGQIIPISPKRILSTGTTATGILGLK